MTDAAGRAAIGWRHIFPNNMRDIAFRTVGDTPASSTEAVRVGEDYWQLEGCPDDGPAMVNDAEGAVHIVWPTLVRDPVPSKGVFYGSTRDGRAFTPRLRLDEGHATAASHPQIALVGSAGLAALWDEPRDGTRRVMLRERSGANGQWSAAEVLPDDSPAYYPAAASVPDALIVVWTSATAPKSTIVVYRRPA